MFTFVYNIPRIIFFMSMEFDFCGTYDEIQPDELKVASRIENDSPEVCSFQLESNSCE